jgi:hypothetical protein
LQAFLSHLVAGSFCWFVASSLWIYPHSLSYFNEFIGGPLNGPKHLLGSNADWGQDLIYLRSRYVERKNSKPFYLAYRSFYNPAFIGFSASRPWPEKILASEGRNENWERGDYAISVSLLFGSKVGFRGGRPGRSTQFVIDKQLLQYCVRASDFVSLGYSIRVYRFD